MRLLVEFTMEDVNEVLTTVIDTLTLADMLNRSEDNHIKILNVVDYSI